MEQDNRLHGYCTVTPTYGRDYKSKALAIAALEAGKDFQLATYGRSGYVSLSDFAPGATVNICYGNLRKIAVYKVRG